MPDEVGPPSIAENQATTSPRAWGVAPTLCWTPANWGKEEQDTVEVRFLSSVATSQVSVWTLVRWRKRPGQPRRRGS